MAHIISNSLHPYETLLAHDNKITSWLWRWELNLQHVYMSSSSKGWKQTIKIQIENEGFVFIAWKLSDI